LRGFVLRSAVLEEQGGKSFGFANYLTTLL
jgi:hypothetical protein